MALAVGHKSPRQFEYWQKGQIKQGSMPGYTAADDRNFRRVLNMAPHEFWQLVKSKSAHL